MRGIRPDSESAFAVNLGIAGLRPACDRQSLLPSAQNTSEPCRPGIAARHLRECSLETVNETDMTASSATTFCTRCGSPAASYAPQCGRCGASLAATGPAPTAPLLPLAPTPPVDGFGPTVDGANLTRDSGVSAPTELHELTRTNSVMPQIIVWGAALLATIVVFVASSPIEFFVNRGSVPVLFANLILAAAFGLAAMWSGAGTGRCLAAAGLALLSQFFLGRIGAYVELSFAFRLDYAVLSAGFFAAWIVARRRGGRAFILLPACAVIAWCATYVGSSDSFATFFDRGTGMMLLLVAIFVLIIAGFGLLASRIPPVLSPRPATTPLLYAGSTHAGADYADRAHMDQRHAGPTPPQNVLAVVAFVLSFFVALAGIVCGHIALSQIKRSHERGRGLAVAALVIGYASLAVIVVVYLLLFAAVR